MTWSAEGEKCFESLKIMWELVPYTHGVGLDVGCGPVKAFPHMLGVDNRHDERYHGIPMDPDITVKDASDMPIFASEFFDFIFSSHLLEHIEDHKKALTEWWRLIKPEGYLILYLPHKELYPNIGTPGSNLEHKHDFLPVDIMQAMADVGKDWDLIRDEVRNEGNEYSFFQVYKKLADGKGHRYSCHLKKPELKAAIVRYGGFGDGVQSASILPGLKAEGYHITCYLSEECYELLKHDPNIDDFVVQFKDQIPNNALGAFWKNERKKYSKWINLSQSIEGTLLPLAGSHAFQWPLKVRQKYMDRNYVEWTHEIAEVPFNGRSEYKFYPTEKEAKWAKDIRAGLGEGPVLMWALAGSSVHKVYPHMDRIVARIMLTIPSARVIFVGGKECEILEDPWRREPRVLCQAGKWSIRETLAMAEECELVIGGETGVLNSVANSPMPKIVFLSHSSHNNLTRDWVNAYALYSKTTPCYPCHQIHYSFDYCPRGKEFEVSQCQEEIPYEAVWAALVDAWEQWCPKLGQKVIAHG